MFGIKTRAKLWLGRLAAKVYPSLAKEALSGNVGGENHKLKNLISRAELARLQANAGNATIEKALAQRWVHENLAEDYYDAYADRFENMFNGPHAQIIDWLQTFAVQTRIKHVIEVGCGDGRALAAMAGRIEEIPRWTGVDINESIIARNFKTYAGQEALHFVTADAVEWLEAHIKPGTLLMTYGGVMEYIAPETLRKWFSVVARNGGAGVLLTEPLDPKHDLTNDLTSYLWGYESSYSHNHRALLEAEGYRIVQSAEATSEGYHTIMILAEPEAMTAAGTQKRPKKNGN